MEIRCDNCTHVGPAASVRPGPEGVVLECENCGHDNSLAFDEAGLEGVAETDGTIDDRNPVDAADTSTDEPTDGPAEADKEASPDVLPDALPDGQPAAGRAVAEEARESAESFGDKDQVRQWLREDALEALIPQPGPGPRCRKCAWLLSPGVDNCSRCGLNRNEAERFSPGEAPWEKPPPQKEAEQEQAQLLWRSFTEESDDAALAKFVDFVSEEGLLDFGIRRLRFYLVEHPEHDRAVEHLRDLAESLQSRLIVAQVQAQADANEFQEDVSRFKQRVMLGMVVFWGLVFVIFVALFWDSCSTSVPNF